MTRAAWALSTIAVTVVMVCTVTIWLKVNTGL